MKSGIMSVVHLLTSSDLGNTNLYVSLNENDCFSAMN
jgi:hypothetical protein